MKIFEIFEFSLEKSYYKPGEIIKGSLNLKTNSGIHATKISILFHGCARVYWTTNSNGLFPDNIPHGNHVVYVQKSLVFSNNNEGYDLNGEYSYPFEIQLPSDMPSSLNGYINYYLRACIHIPWKFKKKIKHPIRVINPVNFNLNSHLKQSVTLEDTQMISSFRCKSLPVTIRLSIAKSGFVVGENIMFDAFIDNQSSRKFKVYFKIISITKLFASDGSTISSSANIARTYFPRNIMEKSRESWTNGALTIPMGIHPSNTTSNVVKLFYFAVLRILGKEMFTRASFDVRMPITIGII